VRVPRAITARAVILGFLLVPLNTFWIVYTEVVRYAAHPTTTSLFFNVVFSVCVLVGLNALLKRYLPRHAFYQGELLVIYTILSLGTAMVGHDLMQVLVSTISYPYRFATPDNRWEQLFFDALPKHLIITDPAAARDLWNGGSSLYKPSILQVWAQPVLIWTGFFSILIFVMMCLNIVWRKQWTENERLAFPIVQVPLQMTDESFSLWRSRVMWLGFVFAGSIDLVNTVSMNYPAVPRLPTREINLAQFLVDRPWNAVGSMPLQFLPFVVGIGFLLPLDLLFSSWFFYFFWKSQTVITAAWGLNDGRPQFPYIPEQAAGAYLGVAVFVVWISRYYLRQVFRRAFGRRSYLDDTTEPMSYRAALLGIAAGMAALVAFVIWSGVTPWVAGAFCAIYFMLSISVTRMRAELGSPAHDLHYAGPDHLLNVVVGPRDLSKQTLAFFAVSWGFNRAYRCHPMPHQMEGFKLAQVSGIRMRPLMWIMLAASVWGCLCAFWALLHVYYQNGAATANIQVPGVPQIFGREPWQRLARWTTPPGPMRDPAQTWFILGGLGFSLFLTAMRGHFLWWPFHPVGLAVSSSWAMGYMWFPLLIAWVAKYAILRGTGLPGYRNALPFFLGLILGEFLVGGLINIAGLVFRFELYRFWG
jgi:uncharacterized protein DUF6785/uncharacterized protein DUF6784